MTRMKGAICCMVLSVLGAVFLAGTLYAAKDDVVTPKEYGVYVKTEKQTKRILPNVVFEDEEIFYVESNNPQRFELKDVQYFVIYGKYDVQYLTLNHLLFFQQSPLGKARFLFGQDVEIDVKKKSDSLYVVKPKGLFGRGYYSLWINDSAWDFIVE